jgi:hypothetical protein
MTAPLELGCPWKYVKNDKNEQLVSSLAPAKVGCKRKEMRNVQRPVGDANFVID